MSDAEIAINGEAAEGVLLVVVEFSAKFLDDRGEVVFERREVGRDPHRFHDVQDGDLGVEAAGESRDEGYHRLATGREVGGKKYVSHDYLCAVEGPKDTSFVVIVP